MANLTDIDSLVPLVELEDEDDEPVYVGFIESSLAKMIPKFFKAIVTLLICGFLLGLTFFLITLWKRGCRKHHKLEEANGNAVTPLHSVVVTPAPEDDHSHGDSKLSHPTSSAPQPGRSKYMKVPKSALLRRASGPFGSEALSFVGEQYQMKHVEKERHHHKEVGFHSGGSSIGGNRSTVGSENEEESSAPKKKWNCFKKTEE